jgi:hypothetical protein
MLRIQKNLVNVPLFLARFTNLKGSDIDGFLVGGACKITEFRSR